jgi:hypothetical protein
MDIILRACTALDPNPYWVENNELYTDDEFTWFYDNSVIIASDTDTSPIVAWGIYTQCSDTFYDGIGLWGDITYDQYFKDLLGLNDADFQMLSDICVWQQVPVDTGDQSPLIDYATAQGYELLPNIEQTYYDAKKAEFEVIT